MTVRVAQQAADVLLTGNPSARVLQQAAEVLLAPGAPKARAAQQAIEVLRSTWDAYPIKVAIANPGAESAESGNEPSSWTENSGDWESLTSVIGNFPIASAHEGSRFLYQQGAVADAVFEQIVQLCNVPNSDIDSGNLVADLTAWQAHNYPDDQGEVIAEFLDADGALLGTIATPLQHVGTSGWVEVAASGAVPPGPRQVRIKLRALLAAGSVLNLAFENLSLVIHEDAAEGSGGQSAVLVVVRCGREQHPPPALRTFRIPRNQQRPRIPWRFPAAKVNRELRNATSPSDYGIIRSCRSNMIHNEPPTMMKIKTAAKASTSSSGCDDCVRSRCKK